MNILIAIDGSDASLKALDHALNLASAMATPPTLAVMNVHDDAFARRHQKQVGKEAVDDWLAEQHEHDLAPALARLQAVGREAGVLRLHGPLADTIVKTARDYDLLVMGSKGRGGLSELVMGSVANRVLHHSTVPVLIVP